jgi:hypothetical protein
MLFRVIKIKNPQRGFRKMMMQDKTGLIKSRIDIEQKFIGPILQGE